MEDKFRWATGFVLPIDQIDALATLLWRFEAVPSVRELIRVLGIGYCEPKSLPPPSEWQKSAQQPRRPAA